MSIRALVMVVAVGCAGAEPPVVELRPEISALHAANRTFDNAAYWTGEVELAAAAWNDALEAFGCAPRFVMIEETSDELVYPVRLIASSEWAHDRGLIGLYQPRDSIDVREVRPNRSNRPTLIHELGHALGLGHSDDPASAMTAKVGVLTAPADIDVRAAAAFGCTP